MRSITAVAVLALTLTGAAAYAQTDAKSRNTTKITSGDVYKQGDKLHMRMVTIMVADVVVTADEAVLDKSTNKVELSGHVRMQLPDAPKGQQ